MDYSKTCLKQLSGHSKEDQKLVFKTEYRLMQVKSILQYFRPSFSYHLPAKINNNLHYGPGMAYGSFGAVWFGCILFALKAS